MITASLAVASGLAVLVWSADRFVAGAAAVARHFGMPPLLIGMVVVGFGTSVPEMVVSVLGALQNAPGIALGNAFGSNIANIGLILGLTAVVGPVAVHSQVLRKELPMLTAVTALAAWALRDDVVSRGDAALLLTAFAGLMGWTIAQGMRVRHDALADGVERELGGDSPSLRRALLETFGGLALLVAASRVLVWGAVVVARSAGVSELVIGLTVVAVGTSLPELASSLAAARRGEHDIALGNVLGSNLFNTLMVVGVAGLVRPLHAGAEVLRRDIPVMGALTVSLFLLGWGLRGPGRINRWEGAGLLAAYAAYTVWLALGASSG
jgi:cation:H+ antiporter